MMTQKLGKLLPEHALEILLAPAAMLTSIACNYRDELLELHLHSGLPLVELGLQLQM